MPKQAIEKAIQGGWKQEVLLRPNCEYEIAELTRPQGRTIGIWFRWTQRVNGKVVEKSLEILAGEIALDSSFWQSLGKALGWEDYEGWTTCANCGQTLNNDCWKRKAEDFYDLILTGGDTEKFWEELLAK
jgi:hypothetical protein